MLLRLFALWTALRMRFLGGRRRRRRSGAYEVATWELGPEDGEPWLLLHGLGSTSLSWLPVLAALRRQCRLVVPELSDLGGTSGPCAGLAARSGARVACDLVERAFRGRPVTLAGLSLGGWMAVRAALARPELLARLLLVDAAGYRDQDWEGIRRLVEVHDLAEVDRLYAALFVHPPWIMRRSRRGFLAAYRSPAVLEVLATLDEEDAFSDDDLARLELPVGLVWGAHDGLFSLAVGRAMAAALPRAHLEILDGCAHAVHLECPRALASAVARFRRWAPVEAAPARPTGS